MKTDRHKIKCKVCKSDICKEIEDRFLAWESPEKIAEAYKPEHDISIDSVRLHCRHFGLGKKRNEDMQGVCLAVINRGMQCLNSLPVDSKAMVSAANLHAKIGGKITDKTEHSGEVTTKFDMSKEMKKQIGNLKSAIGVDSDESISK